MTGAQPYGGIRPWPPKTRNRASDRWWKCVLHCELMRWDVAVGCCAMSAFFDRDLSEFVMGFDGNVFCGVMGFRNFDFLFVFD